MSAPRFMGELGMPSENYRYYCLDGGGQLHSAESFQAGSDEDAIAQVETMHPDAFCEIWHGRRLVASLPRKRLQA